MLMVSREIGSRPFGVILTARRAVFIWGETEVMVPCRIVPKGHRNEHLTNRKGEGPHIGSLCHIPFLSSIVTVSFAHFIKNLRGRPLALVVWEGKP